RRYQHSDALLSRNSTLFYAQAEAMPYKAGNMCCLPTDEPSKVSSELAAPQVCPPPDAPQISAVAG
ncbi:hypothetical protein, partial [Escherichia coli]|uniref:hypothetical protein n=1 Tax=Escherichia coli TaxID=562 RepID=UPI0022818EC1